MNQTELLQEIRLMRFKEAYGGWTGEPSDPGGGSPITGRVRADIPPLH